MIFCGEGGMRRRVSGDKCNEQPGGAGREMLPAIDLWPWGTSRGRRYHPGSKYGERVDSCRCARSPKCLIEWRLNRRWQGWSLKCVHWARGTTCLRTKNGKGSSAARNFPRGQRWGADTWYFLLIYSRSAFDLHRAAHYRNLWHLAGFSAEAFSWNPC